MGQQQQRDLYRDLNDRIRELGDRFDAAGDPILIVCECGDEGCHELIGLTTAEYEDVRQEPGRFAVLPGHELAGLESVVGANDRFLVVEKNGD